MKSIFKALFFISLISLVIISAILNVKIDERDSLREEGVTDLSPSEKHDYTVDFNDFYLIEEYILELDSNIISCVSLFGNDDGSEITYTKEQYDLESEYKDVTHTILGDFSKIYYDTTINYTWIYSSDNNGLRELSLVFTREHSDDYDLAYNSYYVNFDLANQEYTEGIYHTRDNSEKVTKKVYRMETNSAVSFGRNDSYYYSKFLEDTVATLNYCTITAG